MAPVDGFGTGGGETLLSVTSLVASCEEDRSEGEVPPEGGGRRGSGLRIDMRDRSSPRESALVTFRSKESNEHS